MGRAWKPGDVALIEVGCHVNRHRAMFDDGNDGWRYGDKWAMNDPAIVTVIHPLVVIDPEDRKQVERLFASYLEALPERPNFGRDPHTIAMQAALREFADPKPPKPDEPTGWGAVVEASNGWYWTLIAPQSHVWANAAESRRRTYDEIDVVRVVSEGVTP